MQLTWRPTWLQWLIIWASVGAAARLWITDPVWDGMQRVDAGERTAVVILIAGVLVCWQVGKWTPSFGWFSSAKVTQWRRFGLVLGLLTVHALFFVLKGDVSRVPSFADSKTLSVDPQEFLLTLPASTVTLDPSEVKPVAKP